MHSLHVVWECPNRDPCLRFVVGMVETLFGVFLGACSIGFSVIFITVVCHGIDSTQYTLCKLHLTMSKLTVQADNYSVQYVPPAYRNRCDWSD